MDENDNTDWKAIAMALAQRVNFAMKNLTCSGSGVIGDLNKPSSEWQHWRYYMADAMQMIPGVKIDFEILETLHLPPSKRKKAQAAILKSREAPVPDNAELCGGTSATNAVLNGKT